MSSEALSLSALRARIRRFERSCPPSANGVEAVPGLVLPLGCLHQVIAADAAAIGFVARLSGRIAAAAGRPVLWMTGAGLYPPGLAGFGLEPDRLIVLDGGDAPAMEESLRCPALSCVVAELPGLEAVAGRRLQLAAEAGGVTGFVLHPPMPAASNAGTTRWRVSSRPGGRWRVVLDRCRFAPPGEWEVASS